MKRSQGRRPRQKAAKATSAPSCSTRNRSRPAPATACARAYGHTGFFAAVAATPKTSGHAAVPTTASALAKACLKGQISPSMLALRRASPTTTALRAYCPVSPGPHHLAASRAARAGPASRRRRGRQPIQIRLQEHRGRLVGLGHQDPTIATRWSSCHAGSPARSRSSRTAADDRN